METILAAENLGITIGSTIVCKDLCLEVQNRQCWAILGRNGIGKTTLLHTLAGLRNPDQGQLTFLGKSTSDFSGRELAKLRSLMTQTRHDAFTATVMETVLLGRYPYARWLPGDTDEDIAIAQSYLKIADVLELKDRDVATLSGGERARVAFAQMLTQQSKLMLLDEPTGHLDLSHQHNLLTYVKSEIQQDKAALIILHDVNLASRYASHVLMLYGNGEWEAGEAEHLLEPERLSRLYLHPMNMATIENQRIFIPG